MTVVRWCTGLELRRIPVDADPRWIGDETFVRVAGKTMYEFRVVDWRGRTLSRVLSPRRRETEAEMVLSEASKRYGKPEVFMHDGNRVYHRALRNLDLDWREGVVVHRREWVAEDGSTTNPLEGEWSHFRCWCGVHRGFKRWANAQHYHEQYVRARNHPEKTLIQLLIPDK
ncbi:MAG: DDE-type integrase/transposase/recombinase [Candidatus Freyrarchaeum guaymaensis]